MNRESNYKGVKILFHRSYLLLALGFVLMGYYLNLLVFTSLILVHEFGHCLVALIFKINVDKIIIYPYGGMTKLNNLINLDINIELLVACAGVIFQYLFYLLISYLFYYDFIREYTYNLYTLYNRQMIFFNLLPIYPLDGGRILNLLFSKIMSYYSANEWTIILSVIIIIFIIGFDLYQSNYSNIMVICLLFTYLYKFYINRKYLYQRFLLERYLYKIEYDDVRVINNIRSMYKNSSHLINSNNRCLRERDYLSILFK